MQYGKKKTQCYRKKNDVVDDIDLSEKFCEVKSIKIEEDYSY
jgi:hypothetical protein